MVLQFSTRENNEGECIQSSVLRLETNSGREKKKEKRWGEKRRGKDVDGDRKQRCCEFKKRGAVL